MKPKLILYILTVLLLLSNSSSSGQSSSDYSQSDSILISLIEQTWNTHPNLQAMFQMTMAESSAVTMNRAWMNPDLRIGLMNFPQNLDLSMDPMTMFQIGLMQKIPYPGKLKSASASAEAKYRQSLSAWETEKFAMAGMLSMAYYDFLAAKEIQTIYKDGDVLLDEMMHASMIMLESGMGKQSDVLRVRIEKDEWTAKSLQNQGEIERKRAALNYLLNSPIDNNRDLGELPAVLPEVPSAFSIEEFPEKAGAESGLIASQSQLKLAKMNYYPDISLMVVYGIRKDAMEEPRDNMYSVEVSFPIPLFYKGNQRAQIQESQAMFKQKQSELEDITRQKQRQMEELISLWREKSSRLIVLQNQIIPQTKSVWSSLLNEYRAGKANYMELSEIRMKLLMSEMEAVMLKAEILSTRMQFYTSMGKLPENLESR